MPAYEEERAFIYARRLDLDVKILTWEERNAVNAFVIWICACIGAVPEVECVFVIAMWACVYCRH